MKNTKKAFTLIEAILTLVVSVMVFTGLNALMRVKTISNEAVQLEKLQSACQQLQEQDYRLVSLYEKSLVLSKNGQIKRLSLQNRRLVLTGESRGQMILLKGLKEVVFENRGSYQMVKVKTVRGERLLSFLMLDKQEEENAVK